MLYTTNNDTPGMIGLLGTICGKNNVNIANFSLGRDHPGGNAIAMLYLDERVANIFWKNCRVNKFSFSQTAGI